MRPPLERLARAQERLRQRLVLRDDFDPAAVRRVAGADVTFLAARQARTRGLACVAVLTYPDLSLVESAIAEGEVSFPYVPGFLAYRELPLLLRAYERIKGRADLYLIDGQGIAHPRGFGIAACFGAVTGEVAVGCAKSHLFGAYEEPGPQPGDASPLHAPDGSVIGAAVRPGRGTRPLFVSPGHRVSVETAVQIVRGCAKGYRVPEPTRLAHALLQEARRQALSRRGG